MRHFLPITCIVLWLGACAMDRATNNQFTQSSFKSRLDSLLKTFDQRKDFMGSIAITQNGETIYTNAIGFEDIEQQQRAQKETKYRIGSVSKVLTATLILMAVEEEKITLQQTIDAYFPDVKNAKKIAVEHLLNHRSGIPSYTRDKNFINYHTQFRPANEMLELISSFESDFTPGDSAAYSNSNYILLTLILENIYGKSYKDIVTDKISQPLNLNNTYYGEENSTQLNESSSYKFDGGWTKHPETNMSVVMGAGGIVSTSQDLSLFMHALFNEKLISTQQLNKMTTMIDGYGLGTMRFMLSERDCFGHHGSIDGFTSVALYFPEDKLAISILSNGSRNNKDLLLTEALNLYFDDPIIQISAEEIRNYVGTYVNPKDKSDKFVYLLKDNVLIHQIKGEFEEPLKYKGNHQFVFEQVYAESMVFTFSADGKELQVVQGGFEAVFYKE